MNWDDQFGISKTKHCEYLKEFGQAFYNFAKILIDKASNSRNYFENLNNDDKDLLTEVIDHSNLCKSSSEKFFGRIDLLEKVKLKKNLN